MAICEFECWWDGVSPFVRYTVVSHSDLFVLAVSQFFSLTWSELK